MILNTGNRTDIPAFYSKWFFHRIREGYVLERNPYYPEQLIRYRLSPDVVDVICFCTKNPGPMLSRLDEISAFHQFWHVTITPYGREIEPGVPEKRQVLSSFQQLSRLVGRRSIGWRYDPVFLTSEYTVDFHLEQFARMAETLDGYTDQCVISFLDLYQKTRRNFREAAEVGEKDRRFLCTKMVQIAAEHGMKVYTCCEGTEPSLYGADVTGCMTREVLERSLGEELKIPADRRSSRPECRCLLGCDIGMYNTCAHGCLYCYANYDMEIVARNRRLHDPSSPLLIGHVLPGEKITDARQVSYRTGQLRLDL